MLPVWGASCFCVGVALAALSAVRGSDEGWYWHLWSIHLFAKAVMRPHHCATTVFGASLISALHIPAAISFSDCYLRASVGSLLPYHWDVADFWCHYLSSRSAFMVGFSSAFFFFQQHRLALATTVAVSPAVPPACPACVCMLATFRGRHNGRT